MSGAIEYGDEVEKYKVAQAIVERHDITIRPTAMRNILGADSRTYSVYEPGQILAEVPLYFIGRSLSPLSASPDPNWIPMLFVGWLNPFLTALTCVLFFKLCLRFGYSFRVALALTVVFGLTTIAWPYAHGFTREPLLAVLLLGAVYSAVRYAQTGATIWLVTTSAVLGALVFTKFISTVFLPVFFVYLAYALFKKSNSQRTAANLRSIALIAALGLVPLLLIFAIQAAYSVVRFGSPFSGLAGGTPDPLSIYSSLARRGNLLNGIVGLLVAPDKSIFIYSPPLLLFLPAIIVFFSKHKVEALFLVANILVFFLIAAARLDWDGGTWWGPRYLVPLTPLFILPIGILLESKDRGQKRFWKTMLIILALLGFAAQCIGAFVSNRVYLDITNQGIQLFGAFDFLRHGALDSLLVYLSPSGFPLRFNPYSLVLAVFVAIFGGWIVIRLRHEDVSTDSSFRWGALILAAVLVIEFVAFAYWVVMPYPRVLSAKADTHLVAAKNFLADGKCPATAMYLLALERGTTYPHEALARLRDLQPRASGEPIDALDLLRHVEMTEDATATVDRNVTLLGEGAVKIAVPEPHDAIARAVSDPIAVLSGETYELSGWLRTENVYGAGYAVVTVHEDDGAYGNTRTTDAVISDETVGWRPFQKTITTLATTHRIFIAVGLWKTYGTIWVDGVQLARITKENPPSPKLPTVCN